MSLSQWLSSLLAAIIGGAATAGGSWLAINGAGAAGFTVPTLNVKALGIIMLIGSGTNLFAFLKQSPIPMTVHTVKTTQEETVTITISDTGCGIPKEAQKSIFTKLFRAENVIEKDANGNGLGLFIVKQIITNALGGTISFASEENKGTTFCITIPRKGVKKQEGAKTLLEAPQTL